MTPETVKRRDPSGTVWERIGKKQQVQPGDYHWCTTDAPEWVDSETPPHICDIWQKAEDQAWKPPEPPAPQDNPIDSLIDKLKTTAGDLESIPVLAMLYQAKALEQIAHEICEIKGYLILFSPPKVSSGGTVCAMCRLDEHERCLNPRPNSISQADGHHIVGQCQCETCNAPPPCPVAGGPHRFEGMVDNHFCTQCGGGRLHPIHQAA